MSNCPLPTDPNPNPWVDYQPLRQREKEFYDIELRDGTIVMCCYPNGVHWNPWIFGDRYKVPKAAGKRSIPDYRVVRIRLTHPSPFETES
jgi:hypothetical protein